MVIILLMALGLFLLIVGALLLGRFPGFTSDAALLRPPYGRILGGAILLCVLRLWAFNLVINPLAVILSSAALILIALICIISSLNAPVR